MNISKCVKRSIFHPKTTEIELKQQPFKRLQFKIKHLHQLSFQKCQYDQNDVNAQVFGGAASAQDNLCTQQKHHFYIDASNTYANQFFTVRLCMELKYLLMPSNKYAACRFVRSEGKQNDDNNNGLISVTMQEL